MAEKEIKEEKIEKVEKTEQLKSDVTNGKENRRGLIIGVVAAGIIILGLIVGGGIWAYNMVTERTLVRERPAFGASVEQRFGVINPGYGYGRSVRTEITDDKVTTTVYTYQTGVVVAVNNDNIVIAGNGKQTTVKTNSSTQYTNDVKPAVNDTVVIAGTTADSTTTATEIRVANRT